MNKKLSYPVAFLVTLAIYTSCTEEKKQTTTEKTTNVKIDVLQKESRPRMISYVGNVSAESVVRYSFKVGGKIDRILVKKGDQVKPGQKIAHIAATDYNYDYQNAAQELNQAEKALTESENYLEKISKAYNQGGISKSDYEKVKLDLELKKSSKDQATINVNVKQNQLGNTWLRSTIEGTVIEIPAKKGELTGAGNPVVIIKSNKIAIQAGVTSEDIEAIQIGQKASIKYLNKIYQAKVKTITLYPDENTNTYNVEVVPLDPSLLKEKLPLGTLLEVQFSTGSQEGIYIPISIVQSDGEDYVYIAKNNRAQRQYIEIKDIMKEKVKVNGLNSGDSLIILGYKTLRDGTLLNIKYEP